MSFAGAYFLACLFSANDLVSSESDISSSGFERNSRGGAVNNHSGNRRFRQFIQEYKYQYLNETKQKKPFVAMRVIEAVRSGNPPGRYGRMMLILHWRMCVCSICFQHPFKRFLVKYPAGYLEAPEDRAREKGGFREMLLFRCFFLHQH